MCVPELKLTLLSKLAILETSRKFKLHEESNRVSPATSKTKTRKSSAISLPIRRCPSILASVFPASDLSV